MFLLFIDTSGVEQIGFELPLKYAVSSPISVEQASIARHLHYIRNRISSPLPHLNAKRAKSCIAAACDIYAESLELFNNINANYCVNVNACINLCET